MIPTAQELLAMQGLAETALGKMLIKADEAADEVTRVIRMNKQIAELEARLAETAEREILCTTWGDFEALSFHISFLEYKLHRLEMERDYKLLTNRK
jgi:hypothetical protein